MRLRREELEQAVRNACEVRDYERAVRLLIEGYGPELLGFVVSRLRDVTAAEEVFSRFCEDLWRGLPKFEFRSSARVWVYSLSYHALCRYQSGVRREDRRNVPLSQADAISQLEQQVRTATLAALRSDIKTRMAELRGRLPPDEQTLLLLRVQRELDWREIAHVMNEGAILDHDALTREVARLRKRFQLIKRRLRLMAEEAGLFDERLD